MGRVQDQHHFQLFAQNSSSGSGCLCPRPSVPADGAAVEGTRDYAAVLLEGTRDCAAVEEKRGGCAGGGPPRGAPGSTGCSGRVVGPGGRVAGHPECRGCSGDRNLSFEHAPSSLPADLGTYREGLERLGLILPTTVAGACWKGAFTPVQWALRGSSW